MNMTAKQSFKKFAISLPENIWDEVEEMRSVEGRSRSEVIREALRLYLHARRNSPLLSVSGVSFPVREVQER